jgi:homoserine kinase type II
LNAITQLDLLLLEETLAHYDIGELVRYWPTNSSSDSPSYFLRTTLDGHEREFTLTIVDQASPASDPCVVLLDVCANAGLPVAPITRNVHGDPYDTLDGSPIHIAPRLPGRHVYNPTIKQVQSLARFIGRFHIAGANTRIPPYPRGPQWLRQCCELVCPNVGYNRRQLLTQSVSQVCSMLARNDVSELPRGAIHADLLRDNVLFNERGLTGVLNFQHASEGFLIYDLAVAANDWCSDGTGVLDPERTLALLREYQRIRPLTRQELWFFPGFTLYAALEVWLSRLSFAQQPEAAANVRFNNPDELRRIVEQHSAHFFYLDERLLV